MIIFFKRQLILEKYILKKKGGIWSTPIEISLPNLAIKQTDA